ncbi:unnamed protein product [Brachionus calyciflorus]|uniref:DUF4537 domain-containing protein n=1 Tax=Brachionus calyciflorus TaxID=104777 RepID=A0A813M6J6_9BILA|nr:unnamed protein product [Brachionus calyciflorus]
MYYDLDQFEDPKLISFFLNNLKPEPPIYFEEYGDKKKTKKYFYHMHDTVNIMKAPKQGFEKNISRTGIPKMHIFGNAVIKPKQIHAIYCENIHPKVSHKDGTITHPMDEKVLFYQGQEIIARWDIFGVYYSGTIEDIVNTKFADVKFHSGHKIIDVPFTNIIEIKRRKITIGDYVMANVLDEFDKICWVPGIVEHIDYEAKPIKYHVRYYNGEEGVNIYVQLIKINKERYIYIKDFIFNLLLNKQEVVENTFNYDYVDLNENVELFVFSKEYLELKSRYQPLLQPSNDYLSAINSETNDFINMRKSLPTLKNGDEVLAKWPDDCLYYPSVVRDYIGDYKYKVENNLRAVKIITREDLIKQSSNLIKDLKIGDTVLAKHPKFRFVFAPGEIRRLDKYQNKLIIRFYDYSECLIEIVNIYKISREKFEFDINSVIKLENAWIGHEVFAYNFYTRSYDWGRIIRRVLNHRQFVIEWSDKRQSVHCAYFLFVAKNKTYENFKQNIFSFDDFKRIQMMEHEETRLSRLDRVKSYNKLFDDAEYDLVKISKIQGKESRGINYSLINKDRDTPVIDANDAYRGTFLE